MKKALSILTILILLLTAGCGASEQSSESAAESTYRQISQDEAMEMMARDDGHVVVDVRRQDEYDAGHIPGAILIPNESIGCDSPEALPDYDQIILIYCRTGNRSKQAAEKLAAMGYTNIYEFGGINTWEGDIVTNEEEATEVGAFDFEKKSVLLNSGYEMPILGLGTYALDYDTCVSSVKTLLRNGGRLIDTAYMYGNEDAVGEGVRQAMAEYGIPREEIFVITKIYPNQFHDPEAAIDMALEKLNIDYIDMMLLHHPGTDDVKAYKAMEKYVEQGKIRSLGLSNWYIKELTSFLPQVTITPALVQNEIHPYYQEQDVVPFIQNKGIVVQCWYPLGGRGYTAELLGDETICAIAEAHGVPAAQVILRWDLQRGIVVIPGSGNEQHIIENLDLFGLELTPEEMEQIAALDRSEKHDWY
ncbi:MAG: aldo/keto reductase [Oscillospiraceae bacterium]|nr:aldo/keto reductase [Oscillospiraceae bacterium]